MRQTEKGTRSKAKSPSRFAERSGYMTPLKAITPGGPGRD